MASNARKSKNFKPPEEDKGYFHREHRSRKNRRPFFGKVFSDLRRRKIEEIKIKELTNEQS